jgi:hypothetical protein
MAAGAGYVGPSWQVLLHTTTLTGLLVLKTRKPCLQGSAAACTHVCCDAERRMP